ncbi:MAG: hypothetical protein ACK5NF_03065 [Bacilli bacterium]
MNKLNYQKEIIIRLDGSFDNGKLSHAYIFSGVKNSGQLEVANYFAGKIIGCDSDGIRLSHHDVFYISSQKQNIGKQQVVDMLDDISITSMSGNTKVFIVEDAQKLTVSAQNSLLKSIEDPMGNLVFIFIVENLTQLLPTVISRTQIFKFKPLPFNQHYQEILKQYEDVVKLKYALYLDNVDYDELYNSEEFDLYLDFTLKYLDLYINDRKKLMIELEEFCYSKFNSKQKMNTAINLLIINVSTMINFKNGVDGLFDNRMQSINDNITEHELLNLLNKLFVSLEMVNNNVNVKLVIDKLSMDRE